jgi:hypothetical protein
LQSIKKHPTEIILKLMQEKLQNFIQNRVLPVLNCQEPNVESSTKITPIPSWLFGVEDV